MTRRAIVSVGVGYWYSDGVHRLDVSLDTVGELGPARVFRTSEDPDGWPDGCPPHAEVNYGFKIWALWAAKEAGFDQAVWIDSSCWAIRPLQPVWDALDEHRVYLEPDGHPVGEWISDAAVAGLAPLGYHREKLFELPLIEGKLIGVDLRHERALKWLTMMAERAELFNGPWSNDTGEASSDKRVRGHRHEIAVGAVLADRMQLPVQPLKRVACPRPRVQPAKDVVLLAEGMLHW